jgi:hypothetical protein
MVATLTAEDVGAELVGDLRALLDHAEAGTLEELRGLADELTAVLRRTRGRITRLARKTKPAEVNRPEPKPAEPKPEPVPVKVTLPAVTQRPEPVAAVPVARPAPTADRSTTGAWAPPPAEPVSLVKNRPPARPAVPVPTKATPAQRPSPRHVTAVRYVLTALAVLCSTVGAKVARTVRRAVAALTPRRPRIRLRPHRKGLP